MKTTAARTDTLRMRERCPSMTFCGSGDLAVFVWLPALATSVCRGVLTVDFPVSRLNLASWWTGLASIIVTRDVSGRTRFKQLLIFWGAMMTDYFMAVLHIALS